MAKKATKKKTTTKRKKRTNAVTKGSTKPKQRKKVGKKLFKPKKGKNLIKGLVSVGINAGIQKGMNSLFEGRIKKEDYMKKNSNGNEYLDVESYNKAVEQQKTIHGAANIGLWLVGAANSLPKDYVSTEYLEISALEHGVSTFVAKSKNEKLKAAAPYFQAVEDDTILIESADGEVYAMLEAADLIESSEFEEAYIEDYETEEVAYLEEASSIELDSDEDVEIEYEIEEVEGFEGMNRVIPGIEEEN